MHIFQIICTIEAGSVNGCISKSLSGGDRYSAMVWGDWFRGGTIHSLIAQQFKYCIAPHRITTSRSQLPYQPLSIEHYNYTMYASVMNAQTNSKSLLVISILSFLLRRSVPLREISSQCDNHYYSCTAVGKPWQHDGVCLKGKCQAADTLSMELAILIRYRSTKYDPVVDLFIRGTGIGLSWEKPIKMKKYALAIDLWRAELQYTMDSEGLLCLTPTHCSQNQLFVEFRVYRGEEDMFGPNFFLPLPVSQSLRGALSFHTPEITFFPWFFSKTITEKQYSYTSNYLLGKNLEPLQVRYTVLFPPSFEDNLKKSYPLVLMISSSAHIYPVLEDLYIYEASVEEVVVVQVHFALSDSELLPFHHTYELDCKTGNCHDCQTCWDPKQADPCSWEQFISRAAFCFKMIKYLGRAADAINSIKHELLPEIRKRTNHRIVVQYPHNRLTMVGFGDSALLALYATVSHPDTFSNVACISPKLFLPVDSSLIAHSGILALIKEEAAKLQKDPNRQILHTTQKYYFDNGEFDSYFLPTIDALKATDDVVKELKAQFKLEENINIMRMTIPGAALNYEHNSEPDMISSIRFPLLFFFKSAGNPNNGFNHILPKTPEQLQSEDYSQNEGPSEPEEVDIPAPSSNSFLEELFNDTESEGGCGSYKLSLEVFLGSIGWFLVCCCMGMSVRLTGKNVWKINQFIYTH